MRKYQRNFGFLAFEKNYSAKAMDSVFINNDHNLNVMHSSYLDPKKRRSPSYEFFMEGLLRMSKNCFLTDGSANIFRHRFREISLDKTRFCVGDLDSLRTETVSFLARREVPVIFYEDQDRTDLEKCLELVNEFQQFEVGSFGSALDKAHFIDPVFQLDHDCITAQEALKSAAENPFLDEDSKLRSIRSIQEQIVRSEKRDIVIFDFFGSRLDHML